MCVQDLCFGCSNLVESIHVELPHKRLKVGVLEIGGKRPLRKSLDVLHDEASALTAPADHFVVLAALN